MNDNKTKENDFFKLFLEKQKKKEKKEKRNVSFTNVITDF